MAVDIRLRTDEGTAPDVNLQWDTVWDPVNNWGTWTEAKPTEPQNKGGLQARHALATAILLSLFTWKRAAPYEMKNDPDADPQGWWGDAIDLGEGEAPLGSKLHLLLRGRADQATGRLAVAYALEALQPIVDQGAVARFDVNYVLDEVKGLLGLAVDAYGQDGTKIYSQKFEQLWRQEYPDGLRGR